MADTVRQNDKILAGIERTSRFKQRIRKLRLQELLAVAPGRMQYQHGIRDSSLRVTLKLAERPVVQAEPESVSPERKWKSETTKSPSLVSRATSACSLLAKTAHRIITVSHHFGPNIRALLAKTPILPADFAVMSQSPSTACCHSIQLHDNEGPMHQTFLSDLSDEAVRNKISAGLARADVHFYVYDPQTDLLTRITRWNWVLEALLAGDPKPPSYADCHWYPFLHRLPHQGGVVFDVGGFRGYTTAWFAQRAKQVFCFEPYPGNQADIAELMRVRRLSNTELVPCAVSDSSGRAILHVKPFDGHHALADIGATETIDRIEVSVTTLDEFADERGIDRVALLKVDVEGFEPEVFRGAKRLFTRRAIAGVVFEFSPRFYKQRGIDPAAPIRVLDDYGYHVEAPDGGSVAELDLQKDDQRDLFAFPV